MLSGLSSNVFFLRENMTRTCHNHRLQTDPLGSDKEIRYPQHKVKQPAPFQSKMIAELERASRTKLENSGPTKNLNKHGLGVFR